MGVESLCLSLSLFLLFSITGVAPRCASTLMILQAAHAITLTLGLGDGVHGVECVTRRGRCLTPLGGGRTPTLRRFPAAATPRLVLALLPPPHRFVTAAAAAIVAPARRRRPPPPRCRRSPRHRRRHRRRLSPRHRRRRRRRRRRHRDRCPRRRRPSLPLCRLLTVSRLAARRLRTVVAARR